MRMTRIERKGPFIEALSEDAFEEFLAAASHAAGTGSVYDTLSAAERGQIDEAIALLDRGEGVPYETVKARLDAKLKAAGA